LPADFSRSPLEILGGPQSRFPHPVGSGALGVDPMEATFSNLSIASNGFSDISVIS
jgi:hypothetical protein